MTAHETAKLHSIHARYRFRPAAAIKTSHRKPADGQHKYSDSEREEPRRRECLDPLPSAA